MNVGTGPDFWGWTYNGQVPGPEIRVKEGETITVIINPMETIEIEFLAGNPAKWFHHCHNLYHMEAGMANLILYQP